MLFTAAYIIVPQGNKEYSIPQWNRGLKPESLNNNDSNKDNHKDNSS